MSNLKFNPLPQPNNNKQNTQYTHTRTTPKPAYFTIKEIQYKV